MPSLFLHYIKKLESLNKVLDVAYKRELQFKISCTLTKKLGYAVAHLVKALCYKLKGSGFDCNFSNDNTGIPRCTRSHFTRFRNNAI
jgi:hypothetical protein